MVATGDIMPRSELVKTRFYKEWLKPQGIEDGLAVNLEKGTTRCSLVNIRTEAAATKTMRHRLAMLVPHLQRAVVIGRVFNQKTATENALAQTLDHVEAAVFLVRADGAIAFSNNIAKKMLIDAVLVKEERGALHAVTSKTDRILWNIIVSAEKGDASIGVRGVAVPLTDVADGHWFAHVLPLTSGRRQQAAHHLAAVAAVFIRKAQPEAPPPLEKIAKRYKLSASEVRVLDAMLKANGVKAMAETLGLSQATVKTHLHHLFGKTGTARQSELLKLVAGLDVSR